MLVVGPRNRVARPFVPLLVALLAVVLLAVATPDFYRVVVPDALGCLLGQKKNVGAEWALDDNVVFGERLVGLCKDQLRLDHVVGLLELLRKSTRHGRILKRLATHGTARVLGGTNEDGVFRDGRLGPALDAVDADNVLRRAGADVVELQVVVPAHRALEAHVGDSQGSRDMCR